MIRAIFYVNDEDPQPIRWPPKHPYWVSDYTDEQTIVVAYADDEAEILHLWPDATNIEWEVWHKYLFTDRFLKPDWFELPRERTM